MPRRNSSIDKHRDSGTHRNNQTSEQLTRNTRTLETVKRAPSLLEMKEHIGDKRERTQRKRKREKEPEREKERGKERE